MKGHAWSLEQRYKALRLRVEVLSSLRQLAGLPPEHDIARRQWAVIESQLKVAEARLLSRLKRAGRAYLPQVYRAEVACQLNALLGEIELELAEAFIFFDTYMDILTQRHTPELGRLLAGCDVLAWDAINRNHPALAIVEPPLVYCDRGFGASTLREGVLLPGHTPNPMPLVQIPYSRLKEKYNLTSVLHEVGHEAMVRLGLVSMMPIALREALTRAGASENLQSYYAMWSSEIGPDFWTFCASGIAAAGGVKEILALPPQHVFRVAWTDLHPPPYIRVLLEFDWCRQVWGHGVWDEWQKEWLELYPLEDAPQEMRPLLREAKSLIPVISRAVLHTKFRVLEGKTISDLFDLAALTPSEVQRLAQQAEMGVVDLKGLAPCAHLAVFRLLKENGKLGEEKLDQVMTVWLAKLGQKVQ